MEESFALLKLIFLINFILQDINFSISFNVGNINTLSGNINIKKYISNHLITQACELVKIKILFSSPSYSNQTSVSSAFVWSTALISMVEGSGFTIFFGDKGKNLELFLTEWKCWRNWLYVCHHHCQYTGVVVSAHNLLGYSEVLASSLRYLFQTLLSSGA